MLAEPPPLTIVVPSVGADTIKNQNEEIQVAEGQGLSFGLRVKAQVDSSPSMIYSILTDPNSVQVFRNIKECTERTVLEESPCKTQRRMHVAHKAVAKFLFINVTFETKLLVWEDDKQRKIRFCNSQEGFMKKFEGSWNIQPYVEPKVEGSHLNSQKLFNPFQAMQAKWSPKEATSSTVTLEQAIVPRGPCPPGVKHLLRRLCAKQIADMMEDLRAEVDKREGRVAVKTKKGDHGRGKVASSNAVAAAASMTLAHAPLAGLWEHVTPINITIQL